MMLVLFLAAAALSAVSSSDEQKLQLRQGDCPMFWYSFNGRCYKYVASRLTWGDAELQCVSDGANLVSIHSKEEHDFVNSLIKNFDPTRSPTWIGLTDVHVEGRWMWSDGSRVSFTMWNPEEPDNQQGIEHCGHTSYGSDFKWNDAQCSEGFTFVCASRNVCPKNP